MPLALRYDDIERADAGFGVRMMPAIRFSMRSLEHDAHGLVFLTGNDDLRAMTTRLIAAGVPVDPPSTGDRLLPRSR
jgi:hypothetical protein